MTRFFKSAQTTFTRFSVHVLCAVILAVVPAWVLTGFVLSGAPFPYKIAGACFGFCLLAAILFIGIYLLNRENARLKRCAYELHDINHMYRDALSRLFSTRSSEASPNREELLLAERELLNSVCAKVESIFRNLIGRKCVVTVKLLAEKDQEKFCFTWARSSNEVYRVEAGPFKYRVGTGENTGFDEALKPRDSGPCFFYSADLLTDENYKNQRTGWQKLYESTIVVPIRHQIERSKVDVVGFLCVDTKSPRRLNGTYHVQFLAAFADQMYNFVSIMRRKYLVLPNDEERLEKMD